MFMILISVSVCTFENRALRRLFGPKGEEVAGELRNLHNEGLHNLNTTPDTVRMIKVG
jgi:hypothetical protein